MSKKVISDCVIHKREIQLNCEECCDYLRRLRELCDEQPSCKQCPQDDCGMKQGGEGE